MKTIKQVYPSWAKSDWKVWRVGSRETCDPPPTDTDEDFLVLVNCVANTFTSLERKRFRQYKGDAYGESVFSSWRLGDTNAIVTEYEDFAGKFLEASEIAKEENLMRKQDRVDLFQKVLYGNDTNEVPF